MNNVENNNEEYEFLLEPEYEMETGLSSSQQKKTITAKTEEIILAGLIQQPDFLTQTITYFVKDIFEEDAHNIIFEYIKRWYAEYSSKPDVAALKHDINVYLEKIARNSIKEDIEATFNVIEQITTQNNKWLYDVAEEWIRRRRVYLAIRESIEIYNATNENDEKQKKRLKPIESVPKILEEAIAVSFDNSVGMDWFKDAQERYSYYANPVHRTKCGIYILDERTGGGVPSKTLNGFLSSTNVGKTMMMCALSALYIQQGHDVLYITLEMREEEILKRIDANLLDIALEDFPKLEKEVFFSRINKLSEKHLGSLIVKEFPAHGATVNNIRKVLKDIATQNFGRKPKIIMVDYMGLMDSTRLGVGAKTYEIQKSVSEELRGLMMEEDAFCWTGIQTNRSGANNNAAELNQIADSFSVAQTLDYCLSLWSTDEAEQNNLIFMKEIKSRYGNKAACPVMNVGVDKTRQRIFDATESNMQNLNIEKSQRSINEARKDTLNAKLFAKLN